MSDSDNAFDVASGLDIAQWHLGYEAVYQELKRVGKHKAVEAMKYTLKNNINTNQFARLRA